MAIAQYTAKMPLFDVKRPKPSAVTGPPKRRKIIIAVSIAVIWSVFGVVVAIFLFVLDQRVELQRMVENIGRARPPAQGIAINQGAFLSPDQKRLAHDVMSDPRLAAALVYLEHNGGFARGIRLDVNACWGFDRAGTHWDIVNRSLSLCFVQLDAFRDRLKRDNDEDPEQTTRDAALFVLFHELGHAFLTDHRVPLLGREEDAADEFALHLAIAAHSRVVVEGGARFAELIASDGGPSDSHVDPARRAYRLRCLLYGSDSQRVVRWIKEKRADANCISLYAAHERSWRAILQHAK
jgi:Putative metallopeptidase